MFVKGLEESCSNQSSLLPIPVVLMFKIEIVKNNRCN